MNRLIWKSPLADGCCFLCLGFKLRAIVVLSLCRFSSLLSLTTNIFAWSFRTYLKAGSFLVKPSKFCAYETCTTKPFFKGLIFYISGILLQKISVQLNPHLRHPDEMSKTTLNVLFDLPSVNDSQLLGVDLLSTSTTKLPLSIRK